MSYTTVNSVYLHISIFLKLSVQENITVVNVIKFPFYFVGSISKTIVDPLELPINKYYYINLYNINHYKQISNMG